MSDRIALGFNEGVEDAVFVSIQRTSAPHKVREVMVSDIVRERLLKHLLAGEANEDLVLQMQDADFSKKTFDINLPLLKKLKLRENPSVASKDEYGHGRYWVKPVVTHRQGTLPGLLAVLWQTYLPVGALALRARPVKARAFHLRSVNGSNLPTRNRKRLARARLPRVTLLPHRPGRYRAGSLGTTPRRDAGFSMTTSPPNWASQP